MLERQGSLRERRPRYGTISEYVVRYRMPCETGGKKRVQKTLYVGRDPRLADRVRQLLSKWRRPLAEAKLEQAFLDAYGGVIAASRRYGRNATRRWRAWLAQQRADPARGTMNLMFYETLFEEEIVRGKKRGRKSKGALW